MATIANPQESSFSSTDPDEDVAAIVKHISEHAEELYQNWKAQGLAPSEILACRSNVNAAEKFGSVLTPPQQQQQQLQQQQDRPLQLNKTIASSSSSSSSSSSLSPSPEVELLCTSPTSLSRNNNLQQFVNKFVVEDKARLAATTGQQKIAKTYPSSIRHALQKFEKNCSSNPEIAAPLSNPAASSKVKLQKDRTFPEHFIPTSNAPTMKKPDITDGTVNSNTWPLKVHQQQPSSPPTFVDDVTDDGRSTVSARKYATLSSKKTVVDNNSADQYLKEVAKEEEKLISALQSGLVIADDAQQSGLPVSKSALRDVSFSKTEGSPSIERNNKGSSCSRRIIRNGRNLLPVENASESSADVAASHQKPNSLRINQSSSSSSINNTTANSINGANNNGGNPVRPFLTRGSVAERVLMFERCPVSKIEKKPKTTSQATTPWKSFGNDVHSKIQTYSKEVNQRSSPTYPPHTTLQRHTKANKNIFIPRFFYPHGKPVNQQQQNVVLKNVSDAFQLLPNMQATKEQFGSVTKACCLPLYWKAPLFLACGGEKLGYVDMNIFLDYWKELTSACYDDASRFMRIITRSATRSYIIPEDLIPLVQDIVNTHPGLTFLKQAPEFHSRYVHTVICRVYYCVNQSWSGQITLAELKRSDFLRAVQLLEEEEDINQVTAYFSYEHFYVIYCKFWELDRDHDLSIGKEDLARHSDHALSTRIIDRIFSRTRNKGRNSQCQDGRMGYTDFVIFLLAEEDKNHPRAIEYWFRCMDLDGDGYLSMYELEYFYDEQLQRMEAMGIECLPFEDCLCQMLDMIQPKIPGKISLSDLKRCKMTSIFFDTFFNLEKYLDHEQRDPFASQRDNENEMSDWERYAAEEYELLVAEEGGNGSSEDMDSYRQELGEDDDHDIGEECEDDIFSCNLDEILNGPTNDEKSISSFVDNKVYRNANKVYKNNHHHHHRQQQQQQPHHRNGYVIENYYRPSMIVTDYSGDRRCQSDSSDDYAGDSDDGSL